MRTGRVFAGLGLVFLGVLAQVAVAQLPGMQSPQPTPGPQPAQMPQPSMSGPSDSGMGPGPQQQSQPQGGQDQATRNRYQSAGFIGGGGGQGGAPRHTLANS